MDDAPGLFRIDGDLLAFFDFAHSPPVQLQADFQQDDDYVEILKFSSLLEFSVIVYLPEDGFLPISGNVGWELLDIDLNILESGTQQFRVPFSIRNHTSAKYLKFVANSIQQVDSMGAVLSEIPTFYRVGLGLGGDAVGNTISTALPYENNFQGVLGGSIRPDDVDYYSVELEAGTEYEFVIQGNTDRNEQTNLVNPILQLHDESGLLASSSRITGNNISELVFTPPETKTYYLRASSDLAGATSIGTYAIRSPQFDDDQEAGSLLTRTTLRAGETYTSSVDYQRDIDWVRLDIGRYFTYEVATPLDDSISFVNFSGLPGVARPDEQFTGGELTWLKVDSETPVDFRYERVDNDEDNDFAKATLSFSELEGAIDSVGDTDLFKVRLLPFVDYRMFVTESRLGVWSGNLILEHVDSNGSVLRSFDVPEAVEFQFLANEGVVGSRSSKSIERNAYFRVRSDNDDIIGYRVEFRPTNIDVVADTLSTAEEVDLVGGLKRVQGVLEDGNDWDVYQVELKASTWYRLSAKHALSGGGTTGLYRFNEQGDGSSRIQGSSINGSSYYYFDAPGTYYIASGEARAQGLDRGYSSYEWLFAENGLPDSTVVQRSDADRGPLLANGRRLPTQIWTNIELRGTFETANTVPARELTLLTADEWTSLQVDTATTGPAEIIYRSIPADGRRLQWEKIEIVDGRVIEAFNDFVTPRNLTYMFAEELPDYLADDSRFNSSFQPLTGSQQETVRFAINRWRDLISSFDEFDPGNETNRTRIFQADLGDDADLLGFASGSEGLDGDLILNSGSDLFSGDSSPESVFKLIQALGTILGLPKLDSLSRFESVMGTAEVTGPRSEIYPQTLMPADTRLSTFTNFNYDARFHYEFPASGGIAESILARPHEQITVSANNLDQSVSIDLRSGRSSAVVGDNQLRVFHMAPGSNGFRADGGSGNDGLTGNLNDNILVGNAGNDVLIGGSGNDQLLGGPGDDYYIFGPASHLDTVDETGGGGIDVLRIEGMYDYDSIEQDYTFRRFGSDLLIRLELDGQRNNSGDQIRIRNMDQESSRVEAFALLNTNGFVDRISLQSVWDQATEARQRFSVSSERDNFGSLVSPVG